MGRKKSQKTLSNFKKSIESQISIAELALTDNLKNPEDVEEKIEYWCDKLSQ